MESEEKSIFFPVQSPAQKVEMYIILSGSF